MRWLAALMLGAFVLGGAVARLGAEPGVVVQMEDDRLSVSAEEVTLKDILAEIERATSIKVSGQERLDPEVVNEARTVRFRELRVEEAFRRLLPDNDFVVVHSSDRIEVEIQVRGQGSAPPPPGTGGAAQAAPGAPAAEAAPDAPADPTTTTLRDTALNDPDPARRAEAMSQLSRMPDKNSAVETALSVLGRDRETVVLDSALDALRALASVPVESLIEFATNSDRDPTLRVRAIELLGAGALDHRKVQAFLRSAAAQDPSQAVQAAAKRMLQRTSSQ